MTSCLISLAACDHRERSHDHELLERNLLRSIENGSESQKILAISALVDVVPSSRARDRLLHALADSNVAVQLAAAQTLAQVREPRATRQRVMSAVRIALRHREATIRLAAVQLLAALAYRDSAAARLVIGALKDASVDVRAAAAQTLTQIGGGVPDIIHALQMAARDSNPYVREEALNALRAIRAAKQRP